MKKEKASTADILGSQTPADVNAKWQFCYKRLIEIRKKLVRHKAVLGDAARDEQPTFSLHMADAGTDQYDQDFALSMISSEQSALYEIEEALNLIQKGTYGICELTGKPIENARLKAVPWTRFSLQAQHELERQGAVNRTTFSQPSSISKVPEDHSEFEESHGEHE